MGLHARDARAHQALRPRRPGAGCRGRREPSYPRGRGVRAARPQRRRQVDNTQDDLRNAAADGRGEILFAGHAWRREDLYAIGSLIEEAPLYPNLTARENLRVRTTLLGLPESRVDEVLAAVDLADTGKKRAGRFSMGMRQRLGLALALDRPATPARARRAHQRPRPHRHRGAARPDPRLRGGGHDGDRLEPHPLRGAADGGHHRHHLRGRLAYEDALRPGQDLEELFMSVCREGRRARGEVAA